MLELPDLILEKIFIYLDFQDKLNLFLVCKRFKEVLENSLVLMKSIKIVLKRDDSLDPDDFQEALLSCTNRKYMNIEFKQTLQDKFLSLCDNYGKSGDAYNGFMDVNPSLLTLLFEHLPYLEEITFREVNMSPHLIDCDINLFLNLKNLSFFNSNINFEIFKNCENLRQIQVAYHLNRSLQDLLINTHNLKTLSLLETETLKMSNFFTENLTNNVKFQLEELSIDCLNSTNSSNFINFMKDQKSLKKFELHASEIKTENFATSLLDVIFSMESLKSLQLKFTKFSNFKVNIENSLVLSDFKFVNCNIDSISDECASTYLKQIQKMLEFMPNLIKLQIDTFYCFKNLDLLSLNNCHQLEVLSLCNINKSVLKYLEFDNLKEAFFEIQSDSEFEIEEEVLLNFFKFNRRTIEKFEANFLILSDNVWQYIADNLKKLKMIMLHHRICDSVNVQNIKEKMNVLQTSFLKMEIAYNKGFTSFFMYFTGKPFSSI